MSAPLWTAATPLVLASGSAIRRTILESAGIPVVVRPAAIDERAVESGLADRAPASIARALAAAKACAVSKADPDAIVLGADQTLSLGNDCLHKPADHDAARRQLRAMSGRSHHLHSGVALARGGATLVSFVETATIDLRPLSEAFIDRYLEAAGTAVLTSVGVYQIEALGPHLFDRINGDQTTIMGLPLIALLREMRKFGFVAT